MKLWSRWQAGPDVDSVDMFAALRGSGLGGALMVAPRSGSALVAGGEVHAVRGERPDRVAASLASVEIEPLPGEPAPGPPALWIGGMAFDVERHRAEGLWADFPAVNFVLPRFLWWQREGMAWLGAFGADAESCERNAELGRRLLVDAAGSAALEPPGVARDVHLRPGECPEQFRERVEAAVASFAESGLHKVVLARDVKLTAPGGLSPARVLRRLRAGHPDCTTFALASGDATFLGATPERLLQVQGGRIRASALAGSAPRGRSPEEDAAFGRGLLESKKDQEEHAFVVSAIRDALAAHCVSLRAPEGPELLATESIQHLHTPFEGRLRRGVGAAQVMESLHPTPAVGGAPAAPALAWLRAHEPLERGFYAGPVGWLGSDGSGDLGVALRCALLRGDDATLFAGAGIVPGSTPDGELEETRLKLRPLLSAAIEV